MRPRLPPVRMTWHDLLFLHWPVDAARLAAGLPAGLALDVYDGAAWISVVPFRMSGVTPRGLPPLPWLSTTPELNVRTYVRAGGRSGVWFFSLDASNPALVVAARRAFHLPYRHASMTCRRRDGSVEYRSRRTDPSAPPAAFQARYRPAGPAAPPRAGTLEAWLTSRYALFAADAAGGLWRGDIAHAPWPLQPAEVEIGCNTMAAPWIPGPPGPPASLQFAARLDVLASPLVPAG